MFRLPVCPHCNTVYSYKEVKENNKKKEICCYHCKKTFKNSRKGIAILAIIVIILTAIINVFLLNIMTDKFITIIPISIISIAAVIIGMMLIPYFISYKK